MPVYDYRCEECQSNFDIYHKVREVADDVVCPSCGSRKHKRLMSASMVSVNNSSAGVSSAPACENGGCCGGSCGLN